ncbi:hypothetical protein ACFQJ7_04075 [Halovenus rubra]|uniref:Uncharacterized protein n=2 Tax=Halovenus rubra TaxID=869890 RepID=A0ACC7DXA5_9EURY|nr:hypothetical protein [Halovenus rubra]
MPDPLARWSRRRFIAGTTTAAITAVAGCSTVVNWIADKAFKDVNIINELNRSVSGRITVTDPDRVVRLDEMFELPSRDGSSNQEDGNIEFYPDIWTTTGSYEVTIALRDTEIDGVNKSSETVTLANTDEEMLLVSLGASEVAAPIDFRVGESFTDIVSD